MKRSLREDNAMAVQEQQARQQVEERGPGKRQLSEEEQEQVRRLQARDAEVRAHENAHLAAAGGYARGGARYTLQTGPDGRQYAVGGEVSLDVSKEADPRQTLQKAITVQAAALAPAAPSGQDMRVAAKAAMMANEARAEIIAEQKEEFAAEEEAGVGAEAEIGGRDPDNATASVPNAAELTREFGEQQSIEAAQQESARESAFSFIARMVGSRYGMGMLEGPRAGFLAYG